MTNMKRSMISMPKQMEEKVTKIKKMDEYCMMPLSEVLRILVEKGIEQVELQRAN